MWNASFGPHEASFVAAKKAGRKTPLDEKPALIFSLEKYLEAFSDLSKSRIHYVLVKETDKSRKTMLVPNPIQFSEIEAWLRLYNVPKSDWSDFVYLITAMDAAWIDLNHEKLNGNT